MTELLSTDERLVLENNVDRFEDLVYDANQVVSALKDIDPTHTLIGAALGISIVAEQGAVSLRESIDRMWPEFKVQT